MNDLKNRIKKEIVNAMHNGYLTKEYGEKFKNNPKVDACAEESTNTILNIMTDRILGKES